MAEAARALEDIEELAAAPLPQLSFEFHKGVAAKALAKRMVSGERRKSEARHRKLEEAVEWLARPDASAEAVALRESARDLLSSRAAQLELRLEADAAAWAEIYGRIPLPAPLSALREIQHGFRDIVSREHDSFVSGYYRLHAALLERDPKAQPTGEIASSPGDIDAYFARLRGK